MYNESNIITYLITREIGSLHPFFYGKIVILCRPLGASKEIEINKKND